ncbi:MAG TPA: ferrochelatase, partial [Pseudogracilibacillus sp.]|nr:ferrochelatase [Pseudogracilibacillus sp.]
MTKKRVGLLVMAYGTPYKASDIKPYYTHIRNGREPSEEALLDLTEKYEAIGGVSPMAKITKAQVNALADTLNSMQAEIEFIPYIGLKHIEPFIEDAVAEIAEAGIKEIASIVLAPHYSSLSIKGYNKRANEEAGKYGITVNSVESWYDEAGYIEYWAKAIQDEYDKMTDIEKEKSVTIFSAHSLPKNILKIDDPYVDQLEETA